MVARILFAVTIILVPALGHADEGQNAPASVPIDTRALGDWSKPLNGLAVRVVADRAVYYPGEQMRLLADARNVGANMIYVRKGGELHLLTPSGEHMVHTYSKRNRSRPQPGGSVTLGDWRSIRLVKGRRHWRVPSEWDGTPTPLDLSRHGTYTFWYEYEAKPGWPEVFNKQAAERGEPAWTGKIASPRLKVEVRELDDAAVVHRLTDTQTDDLRIIAEGSDKHDRRELERANDRLAKDLLLAKNVGLADAATALVVELATESPDDPLHPWRFLYLSLACRAIEKYQTRDWPPVELAIRGPYLRSLAELQLDSLKAWYGMSPSQTGDGYGGELRYPSFYILLALSMDSEDEPLRVPLAELALTNAELPNPLPWRHGMGRNNEDPTLLIRHYHARLLSAWTLLKALDLLQGKTADEVIAILGKPTNRYQERIGWYAASRMHVNPSIRVILVEGKVQSVSCGSN